MNIPYKLEIKGINNLEPLQGSGLHLWVFPAFHTGLFKFNPFGVWGYILALSRSFYHLTFSDGRQVLSGIYEAIAGLFMSKLSPWLIISFFTTKWYRIQR